MATAWNMKGTLLGACSCDWGCPCSFDADPTRGFCEGGYLWHVEAGSFGKVGLTGVTFAWYGHAPQAMHKGNVTWMIAVDEKTTPEQRHALSKLGEGRAGGPWAIFVAVSSRIHSPRFVRFELELDGMNSKARADGLLEMALGPILNPVTGHPEELYLDKPTGFTAKRTTLGASRVFRVDSDLQYDHSGKYGEYSKFDYAGECPD
jgi:hypothetical protein